jgi:hypothetical protein
LKRFQVSWWKFCGFKSTINSIDSINTKHQGTIMAPTIYGPIWSAKHRHLISIYHHYRSTVATTVAPCPHVAAAFMVGDSEFIKVYISSQPPNVSG